MATRNPKGQFARKQTLVDDTVDVDAKYTQFSDLFEEFGQIKYPFAGVLVNLVTSAFGIYAGMHTAAWIGVAALLVTGSTFLGMLTAFIAGFIFAIQSLRAGAYVGKYVATGEFEEHYQQARGWISDKLSGLNKKFMAAKATVH